MDPDVLLTQLYRVDTGDNATMRTGVVRAVYPIRGTIDVEVAGELLREIPYGAGLNPAVDSTVWLIEQGNWFAAISAAASSGQYAGVDEVLVGGEPPTASAVDLWMDTNNVGEGDGWAVLDGRYAEIDHVHRSTAEFIWTYDTGTTMADPGAGRLRTNALTAEASTSIAVDKLAAGGVDASAVLGALAKGDLIHFQQADDATNWGRYALTAAPINNGSWFQLSVSSAELHGTSIPKNDDLLLRFTYGTAGGGDGGGGSASQVIDFPTPSTTWVVDIGKLTDVVVTDSAGHVIWPGDVLYGPGTKVTLTFSAPFSGKVQCYP